MTEVPFVPNSDDDMHCVQACFSMMLQHFVPETAPDWDALERLTHAIAGKGTWWFPAIAELSALGLECRYITTFDFPTFERDGEQYVRSVFSPEVAAWYLEKSNLLAAIDMVEPFLASGVYEKRSASTDDLDALLGEGWLAGIDLNSNVLNGNAGFSSHMVVVFDRHDDGYRLHDPGLPPSANRLVSAEALHSAWSYSGDELSLLAVRGREAN